MRVIRMHEMRLCGAMHVCMYSCRAGMSCTNEYVCVCPHVCVCMCMLVCMDLYMTQLVFRHAARLCANMHALLNDDMSVFVEGMSVFTSALHYLFMCAPACIYLMIHICM